MDARLSRCRILKSERAIPNPNCTAQGQLSERIHPGLPPMLGIGLLALGKRLAVPPLTALHAECIGSVTTVFHKSTLRSTQAGSNQIEVYFSIVQRKALTPNDFKCLQAVADRLGNFERQYESIARPFEWCFSRGDLNTLMTRMRSRYYETQLKKEAGRCHDLPSQFIGVACVRCGRFAPSS